MVTHWVTDTCRAGGHQLLLGSCGSLREAMSLVDRYGDRALVASQQQRPAGALQVVQPRQVPPASLPGFVPRPTSVVCLFASQPRTWDNAAPDWSSLSRLVAILDEEFDPSGVWDIESPHVHLAPELLLTPEHSGRLSARGESPGFVRVMSPQLHLDEMLPLIRPYADQRRLMAGPSVRATALRTVFGATLRPLPVTSFDLHLRFTTPICQVDHFLAVICQAIGAGNTWSTSVGGFQGISGDGTALHPLSVSLPALAFGPRKLESTVSADGSQVTLREQITMHACYLGNCFSQDALAVLFRLDPTQPPPSRPSFVRLAFPTAN